jgi:hypothetical protein
MALYKYPQVLQRSSSAAFDAIYQPGASAPHSGIYRCTVCGHQAVSTAGYPLPPQSHHVHPNRQPIRWQLVVASTQA